MSLGFFSAVKEGSLRMVPKHMADSTVKKTMQKTCGASQFWWSLFTAVSHPATFLAGASAAQAYHASTIAEQAAHMADQYQREGHEFRG